MRELLTCPNCGFRFDLSYGRAFACKGCPSSAIESCGFARCPRCHFEFPLD